MERKNGNCKIGKRKQRNIQEERKTGNVIFSKKNTSGISGHELRKCDEQRTEKTKLETDWKKLEEIT